MIPTVHKAFNKPPYSRTQRARAYLFEPRSSDEDQRRREFIFNILLFGAFLLIFAAEVLVLITYVERGAAYSGISPLVLLPPLLLIVGMFCAVKRRFTNTMPYIFLAMFLVLATYGLYDAGNGQTQALMTYVMVIIMAGIVISSRASLVMATLSLIAMLGVSYVGSAGKNGGSGANTERLAAADAIISGFIFGVILLVTWLSTREIERSFAKAKASERALLRERNSLEVKVRKRTRELERAQVDKMMQLHRFAEFGRFSSTLLHELANPLTSVSLELAQLKGTGQAEVVAQAQKGIAYMEQYVDAARRQLRNQSEVKVFDVSAEIARVVDFINTKAKLHRVQITLDVARGMRLQGDSIRFDQLLANLLANAIDASNPPRARQPKAVRVTMKPVGIWLELSVLDKGTGISATDLPHIFEPFYTTKAVDRGTGLGLAVTKQAVEEEFGGTIRVTSSPRRGTKFVVRLPRHE